LVTFSRDAATGQLTFVATTTPASDAPAPLIVAANVSPDGSYVYILSWHDGPSPENPADGVSQLQAYSRDPSTGALTFVTEVQDTSPRPTRPTSGFPISPDGRHLYSQVLEDASSIAVLSHNTTTGELTFVGEQAFATSVVVEAVSPDGKHIYAYGSNNTLVALDRDATTGLLQISKVYDGSLRTIHGGFFPGAGPLDVSLDGAQLYTVNPSLSVFGRDATTGELHLDQVIPAPEGNRFGIQGGMVGANDVIASPDGNHVYVTVSDGKDSRLLAFRRVDEVFAPLERVSISVPKKLSVARRLGVYVHLISPDENVKATAKGAITIPQDAGKRSATETIRFAKVRTRIAAGGDEELLLKPGGSKRDAKRATQQVLAALGRRSVPGKVFVKFRDEAGNTRVFKEAFKFSK